MAKKYKKIVLKVIKDHEINWVHLCNISRSLFYEFFDVVGCERSEFGAFLSVWTKQDFRQNLSFSKYEDIQVLRDLVSDKYKREYPELYYLSEEENPRIEGWMRLWLSKHMRMEIVSKLAEKEIDRRREENSNEQPAEDLSSGF